MLISDLNWMEVEALLQRDDRCILPLGCCEQHGYLSLSTDSILAEKVSVDAAEPIHVPVFPALAFGVTPSFMAYPGTVSISFSTYCSFVVDVLGCLAAHGFRRILVVNGHGGNSPARAAVQEWASRSAARVKWHDWWNAPLTWEAVTRIDPVASHASWMENFPWTRLQNEPKEPESKAPIDPNLLRQMSSEEVRQYLGDGNCGGRYSRNDAEMMRIWDVAVNETRSLLEVGWAGSS